MSQLLVHHFLAELDRLRKISGTSRETVVREAFKDLLKAWGKAHDLQFIPEYEIITPAKTRIYPDGALLHSLRVPFGYWEAKDEADDLDAEIEKKFKKGYPRDNIIFEDSRKRRRRTRRSARNSILTASATIKRRSSICSPA